MNMQIKMSKTCWSLCVAGLLLMAGPQAMAATTQSLDKVVAIVDEDVVLESELRERMQSVLARLKGQYNDLPDESVLRKQVLEQLVLERIELGLAKRYEIKVEDAEIDQAIDRIAQKNQMNRDQLYADLKRQGLTVEGLRNQLRDEITISHLQQGVVSNRIKISQQEIDNFLASSDGKFATSPDYHIGLSHWPHPHCCTQLCRCRHHCGGREKGQRPPRKIKGWWRLCPIGNCQLQRPGSAAGRRHRLA
jgi:peptidyl-prolyl cis-trans isomerase SurA